MKKSYLLRVMRLLVLFLLAGLMHVSAASYSQITLSGKNIAFEDALNAIRQQGGYAVTADRILLGIAKPISIEANDMPVEEFLHAILRDQPLEAKLEDKTIVLRRKPNSVIASKRGGQAASNEPTLIPAYPEVRGRVVDSLGNPLPGASVRVLNAEAKRTTLQTKTDQDGYFELKNVPEGYQLELSYIGHVATTIMAAADVGSVVLKEIPSELEEVEVMVNTGYQQLPKERATGSFVQIDNERLNEQIQFNVLDRLPILTSGMVVDRNAKLSSEQMLVRGVGTILGNTTPLVVLDNFPYEGDIENINPDDIESVTVLRDAAAASIWGAKAANGVIVLTSKKAKPNQKISANFSTLTAIQSKPDLFALDLVSSSDMIDVEQMLFENGYHTGIINSVSRPAVSPVVELLIKKGNTADPEELGNIEREINRLRTRDVRNDFLRYMYRPGLQSQNTLNLAMGTDRFAWNASAGHGINRNDLGNETNRSNFLVSSRMYISKRLRVDGGINVSFLKSKSGRPGYGNINAYSNGLFPYAEFADADGNALPVIMNNRLSYLETLTDPELLDWKYYPLEDYKHNRNTQRSTHVTLTSGLEFDLLKWLKLSVNYQFQTQRGLSENLRTIDSYEARNTVNMYAKRNPQTGELEFPVPKGGMLTTANDAMQAHNLRGQVAYHWQSNDHEVVGLLGSEVRSHSFQNKSDKLFGYNPENLTYTPVDLTRQYTNFISGAQGFIPSGIALNQRKNNFISTYANGAYTYRQRYTATFSARRDASNLFGLNVNDKWNPFWSVGASWELSKEDFWHSSMVDYLKIRATYGSTGNLDPSKVALTTIRYVGSNPYNQLPYARVQTYVNPELKWETVSTTNVGIDFSLLQHRIKGSLEGYLKVGTDLYGSTPVDYTGGTNPIITKNVASMIGRGIDLEINTMNTVGVLRWSSHLNVSMNRDKVTKYYIENETATTFIGSGSTNSVTGRENYPVNAMYSYKWAGLDPEDGAPLGYLNGEVSRAYRQFTLSAANVDDLNYHGGILPKWFGSFGNTLKWRDFAMTFRLSYKFDYYFRRATVRYSRLYAAWDGHGDFYKRWQKPGDEKTTNVPAMEYPILSGAENFYPYAEPFVERGDHIRLEYINFSYAIPLAPKWNVRRLDVFFNMNNLGLLYNRNSAGVDPDFSGISSVGISPATIYSLRIQCAL